MDPHKTASTNRCALDDECRQQAIERNIAVSTECPCKTWIDKRKCKPLDIAPFLADGMKNLTMNQSCPEIFCEMEGEQPVDGPQIFLSGNSLMMKYISSIVEALAGRFSKV
jgi:hypothetical protein